MLVAQLRLLNAQILEGDRRIRTSARSTEDGRRLGGGVTRYDKTVDSFLGFVLVGSIRMWIRLFVHAA